MERPCGRDAVRAIRPRRGRSKALGVRRAAKKLGNRKDRDRLRRIAHLLRSALRMCHLSGVSDDRTTESRHPPRRPPPPTEATVYRAPRALLARQAPREDDAPRDEGRERATDSLRPESDGHSKQDGVGASDPMSCTSVPIPTPVPDPDPPVPERAATSADGCPDPPPSDRATDAPACVTVSVVQRAVCTSEVRCPSAAQPSKRSPPRTCDPRSCAPPPSLQPQSQSRSRAPGDSPSANRPEAPVPGGLRARPSVAATVPHARTAGRPPSAAAPIPPSPVLAAPIQPTTGGVVSAPWRPASRQAAASGGDITGELRAVVVTAAWLPDACGDYPNDVVGQLRGTGLFGPVVRLYDAAERPSVVTAYGVRSVPCVLFLASARKPGRAVANPDPLPPRFTELRAARLVGKCKRKVLALAVRAAMTEAVRAFPSVRFWSGTENPDAMCIDVTREDMDAEPNPFFSREMLCRASAAAPSSSRSVLAADSSSGAQPCRDGVARKAPRAAG